MRPEKLRERLEYAPDRLAVLRQVARTLVRRIPQGRAAALRRFRVALTQITPRTDEEEGFIAALLEVALAGESAATRERFTPGLRPIDPATVAAAVALGGVFTGDMTDAEAWAEARRVWPLSEG